MNKETIDEALPVEPPVGSCIVCIDSIGRMFYAFVRQSPGMTEWYEDGIVEPKTMAEVKQYIYDERLEIIDIFEGRVL
jgi:hypothetical protein